MRFLLVLLLCETCLSLWSLAVVIWQEASVGSWPFGVSDGFLPASASLRRSEWRFVLTHFQWKGHGISICCVPASAWWNDSFAISVCVCLCERENGLRCGSLVAVTVTQSIMTDRLIASKEGPIRKKTFDCTCWQLKQKHGLSSLRASYSQWCTTDLEGATQVVFCHTLACIMGIIWLMETCYFWQSFSCKYVLLFLVDFWQVLSFCLLLIQHFLNRNVYSLHYMTGTQLKK